MTHTNDTSMRGACVGGAMGSLPHAERACERTETTVLPSGKTVVCPGSFDPITNGHLDIIRRAATLFDHVIIVVAHNQEKQGFFTPDERVTLIHKVLATEPALQNVTVELWSNLLVDFVRTRGANAIVKGLRAVSDFEYEFQMALTNRSLLPDCETLFFTPSAQNMYLSSNIVRQVCALGGDIGEFVPHCVQDDIVAKLRK